MHIKSNIELNIVHLAVLAICPLMFVMTNATEALFFVSATAVCFLISVFVCFVFNKYLSKSIKIFITAILSTFLITIFNLLLDKFNILNLKASNLNFYAVLSTIVLSVDVFYIDTKARHKKYFANIMSAIFNFAVLTLVFIVVKEFLSKGTLFNQSLFAFKGVEFFGGVTFNLLWLGLLCALAQMVYRAIKKKTNDKKMAYQKFVKKIRNEKVFQYDKLRREKVLVNTIEVNTIGGEMAEDISEKSEENEIVEQKPSEEETNVTEPQKPEKRKKNKHFKASKETKIEKVYDDERREAK